MRAILAQSVDIRVEPSKAHRCSRYGLKNLIELDMLQGGRVYRPVIEERMSACGQGSSSVCACTLVGGY